MDSNNLFWISLNILGRTVFDFFKFKHSLASYKPVHAVVASVLVSTLSTTSLAALSSFLSSRSTCSTILPWASMPTYRDKEIEFRIAEKYNCWKENKSRWKNQYSSCHGGRRRGLCRSVPVSHQSGRRAVLTISGNCLGLPIKIYHAFWNFSLHLCQKTHPPSLARLD